MCFSKFYGNCDRVLRRHHLVGMLEKIGVGRERVRETPQSHNCDDSDSCPHSSAIE